MYKKSFLANINFRKNHWNHCLYICDTLRDLVPFAQSKKREEHPWRSVNFSKVAEFRHDNSRFAILLDSLQLIKKCIWISFLPTCFYQTVLTWLNTPPWAFFTFFKLYKCYQTAQSTTYCHIYSGFFDWWKGRKEVNYTPIAI